MSAIQVTGRLIKDLTITSADLADGAISLAKLGALTTKGDLLGFSTVHARLAVGSNGQVLSADSTAATGLKWVAAGSGSGTVTSVAMTVPSIMSIAGSPVTTSGTLAVTLATESANLVFAGPTSGGAATPTFRSLVAADMPTGSMSPLTTKGDVYTFSTVDARLAVGANGEVLSADSTAATGLKWIAAAGGSSPLTTKGDLYTFSTVNAALAVGADGKVLSADSTQATGLKWIAAGGTGTVTSVDLTMPGVFSVSGNPVTTSGTLAVALATQTANTVWAGPTTGGAATPTFRALVAADIPAGAGGGISLVYVNAAASSAIGASSSAENDFDKTYTFPANSLVAGDVYRIRAAISGNNAVSTQTHTFKIYLGTNAIQIPYGNSNLAGTGALSVNAEVLFTVRTTGSGGTVDSVGNLITTNASSGTSSTANSAGIAIVVDTTAVAVCKASYKFSSSNISNNATLRQFIIEKIGAGT